MRAERALEPALKLVQAVSAELSTLQSRKKYPAGAHLPQSIVIEGSSARIGTTPDFVKEFRNLVF